MEPFKDILYLTHHRSKQRIRDLGEVFTPEKYVQQMLDMLDKSVWADTKTVFFEPTCGHGNFVLAIVERRLNAFLKKARKQKIKKPHFYSVANTLNNLWAIDIDSKNIELCRERVRKITFDFLMKYEKKDFFSSKIFIKENKVFLTHVLCCIEWQIQENETLSCLEEDHMKAEQNSNQTSISKKWFKKNAHRPINFKMSWYEYFKCMQKDNIIPIEYAKYFKLLSSSMYKTKQIKSQTIIGVNSFTFHDSSFFKQSA